MVKKKFVFLHNTSEKKGIHENELDFQKKFCPETFYSVALMQYSYSWWTLPGFAFTFS